MIMWILLASVITLAIALITIFFRFRSPTNLETLVTTLKDIGGLKTQVDTIASNQSTFQQTISTLESSLKNLETKIVETTGDVKSDVSKDIVEMRRSIDGLKTELETKKRRDEDLQVATRRIESVLAGSRSRGASGENILGDAFKQFPPGMIDYNFKVKGKPVEYALILTNQKRLPIDSKWPGLDLLEHLSQELDPQRRKELEEEVEKALLKKVKEVAQYIDPITTVPQAIAAVPNAVFEICRRAHIEAFRDRVLLMPYSMTIPYILGLYNLHLQYSRSIDLENLEGYLGQIEYSLNEIDKVLENSVARGATMVNNAYAECKRLVGELKGSVGYLKALPAESVERLSLPVEKSEKVE